MLVALGTLLAALPISAPVAPCDPAPDAVPESPARTNVRLGRRSSATEPGTSLTPTWAVLQLLPSPELALGEGGARFGLRWQFVPLLYSFGIDRRLNPFRTFVVEPLVRSSGSLELFFAPEYLALDADLARRFGFRVGLRAYFPVIERGDYLSVSVGTAYVYFAGTPSASYQLGAYLLFGFLGFEQSFVPGLAEARWISTLNVRFF